MSRCWWRRVGSFPARLTIHPLPPPVELAKKPKDDDGRPEGVETRRSIQSARENSIRRCAVLEISWQRRSCCPNELIDDCIPLLRYFSSAKFLHICCPTRPDPVHAHALAISGPLLTNEPVSGNGAATPSPLTRPPHPDQLPRYFQGKETWARPGIEVVETNFRFHAPAHRALEQGENRSPFQINTRQL